MIYPEGREQIERTESPLTTLDGLLLFAGAAATSVPIIFDAMVEGIVLILMNE